MTTYNTGNPLGSADPKDLFDNAQNLDKAVNDTTAGTFVDRKGATRLTWKGIQDSGTGDPSIAVDAAQRSEDAATRAETAESNVEANAVTIAENAANIAVADVVAAVDGSVAEAEGFANTAEAARDAAIAGANIFDDTVDGLAGTVSGDYFQIPSATATGYVDLYLNNAGVADYIDTLPNLPYVSEALNIPAIRYNLGDNQWNRVFSATTNLTVNSDFTYTLGNSGSYIREINLTGDQLTASVLHLIFDQISGAASTIQLTQYNVGVATSAAVNIPLVDGQRAITFNRDALANRIRLTVQTGAAETITFGTPGIGIGAAVSAQENRLLLVSEAWNTFSGSTEAPKRIMSSLVKQSGTGSAGTLAPDGLTALLPADTTHRVDVALGETLLTSDEILVMIRVSAPVQTIQAAPVSIVTTGTNVTLAYFRDNWFYGILSANVSGSGADKVRFTVTNADLSGTVPSVDVTVSEVMAYPRTNKLPAFLEVPGIIQKSIEQSAAGFAAWAQPLVQQMGALQSDLIYFVDPYNGSDSNDGLTTDSPFKSVTKLRDTLELLPNSTVAFAAVRNGRYLQQTLDIRPWIAGVGTSGHTLTIAFEKGSVLRWLDKAQSTHPSAARQNGIQYGDNTTGSLTVYGNGLEVIGFSEFTGNSCGGFGPTVLFYDCHSSECQDGFTTHSGGNMFLYNCSARECTKACMENVGTNTTVATGCVFTGFAGATKGIVSLPASEAVIGIFEDCEFYAATADQTMDLNNGSTINGGVLGDPNGSRIAIISTDDDYQIGNTQLPWVSNFTEI